MPKVCVLLANGFEEIEAVTIVDVLRRAEIDTRIVSVDDANPTGAHGIQVAANLRLGPASEVTWDMVVLPGGIPGATTLRDNDGVQALLKKHSAGGGRIGAICAAPIALGKAGLLDGRKATCYPSFEDQLTGATTVENPVVIDGKITTSRGPGTALQFALSLVEQLVGKEKANAIAEGMLTSR